MTVPSLYSCLIALLLAAGSLTCVAQHAPSQDSTSQHQIRDTLRQAAPARPPAAKAPDLVNVLIYDFFTTLNAIRYDHSLEEGQQSQLYFYYNFTASNNARLKYFTLRTNIFNEYGFRYYIDSLSMKADDQYYIRNTLQLPIRKKLSFQATFNAKTQLWATYNYREDASGNRTRYLYSDYFSPGYLLYSAGLSFDFLDNANINLGLVGGKTTRIRNQQIFEDRQSKKLYGLEKGQRTQVNYGFNLIINVPPQKIGKTVAWELSSQVFAPKDQISRLKGYTLSANNALHLIFLKYMRLSLRTQLQYEAAIQEQVFMMNHLSLGFYLSNKI